MCRLLVVVPVEGQGGCVVRGAVGPDEGGVGAGCGAEGQRWAEAQRTGSNLQGHYLTHVHPQGPNTKSSPHSNAVMQLCVLRPVMVVVKVMYV